VKINIRSGINLEKDLHVGARKKNIVSIIMMKKSISKKLTGIIIINWFNASAATRRCFPGERS